MKTNFLYLLLCLGLLTVTACGDDDDGVGSRAELNYAGPRVNAPQLQPNTSHIFSAYFPATRTRELQGRFLEEIEFELVEVPVATYVTVFEAFPGDDDAPSDNRLFDLDVTNRMSVGVQNVRLPNPIEITGEGLWLSVEVQLGPNQTQSVGCDAGRNYSPNGDRLLTDGFWTDFFTVTGSERVNWNIKGYVSAE